jgi:hypothetical protein
VSFDHLYFRTGDQEEDLRRQERIAWVHYLRVAKTLANTPIERAWSPRQRVEAAKAAFAKAWRALDEVSP